MSVARFETLLMLEFEVDAGTTEVVLRLPDGTERSLGKIIADDVSVTHMEGWRVRNGIHLMGAYPLYIGGMGE